ncbi:MAG: hypothetical protein ACKPKO_28390, partial [Candidatus Fonsibacter sp.]
LRREFQLHGVLIRWQEVEPTLGWWLLANLQLDFLVLHTSDTRWYIPGTYEYDVTDTRLYTKMAFNANLAQRWMIEFLRSDKALALEALRLGAYSYSKGGDYSAPIPADLSCLNGFRIYIGLLNIMTDRSWKVRFEVALARLRPTCTPTIIVSWCTDALPCDWRNHEDFVTHALYDSILDKHAHQKLYFSPA